jgi:aconitate hydratase
MGVLPLQFAPGDSAHSLGLTGEETYTIRGLADLPAEITVQAEGPADTRRFTARVRLDTPTEADNCQHGGILPHALRALLPT